MTSFQDVQSSFSGDNDCEIAICLKSIFIRKQTPVFHRYENGNGNAIAMHQSDISTQR